jgi:hypothetical protein
MLTGALAVAIMLSLFSLPVLVSAQGMDFSSGICSLLRQINNAVLVLGPTLVAVMFLYGGIKYVMAADNPGGRNQGKTICIHAMVGGLLIGLWTVVKTIVTSSLPTSFGGCG